MLSLPTCIHTDVSLVKQQQVTHICQYWRVPNFISLRQESEIPSERERPGRLSLCPLPFPLPIPLFTLSRSPSCSPNSACVPVQLAPSLFATCSTYMLRLPRERASEGQHILWRCGNNLKKQGHITIRILAPRVGHVAPKMAAPGRLQRSVAWAPAGPEETRRGCSCTEARVRYTALKNDILRLKMKNHEPDGTIIKENLIDFIAQKINQLPEAERNLLENGSVYVGLNAALCGLIANSLFRRILHVTQAV